MAVTPLEQACTYIHRGWAPIPIPHGTKGLTIPDWQELQLDEAAAASPGLQFAETPLCR